MEAFSKFGSDLDAATLAVLEKGRRNVEILKQNQYSPLTVEKQIAIIYCGTYNLLKEVPVNQVKEFEEEFLNHLELHEKGLLEQLKQGNLSEEITNKIEKIASEIAPRYKKA